MTEKGTLKRGLQSDVLCESAKKLKSNLPSMDDVINFVASQDYVPPANTVHNDKPELSTAAAFSNLFAEISNLHSIVSQQQKTIEMLTCRLDFALSMLGVADNGQPTSQDAAGSAGSTGSGAAAASYADVTKRPSVANYKLKKDSIVAAMYVDGQRKASRATNIIVSGLPVTSSAQSDMSTVVEIFRREFNEVPEITFNKRIGKPMPGRIQPLLVVLKSAEQASRYVASGKKATTIH